MSSLRPQFQGERGREQCQTHTCRYDPFHHFFSEDSGHFIVPYSTAEGGSGVKKVVQGGHDVLTLALMLNLRHAALSIASAGSAWSVRSYMPATPKCSFLESVIWLAFWNSFATACYGGHTQTSGIHTDFSEAETQRHGYLLLLLLSEVSENMVTIVLSSAPKLCSGASIVRHHRNNKNKFASIQRCKWVLSRHLIL